MRILKDMKTAMDTHMCASRFYTCVPRDLCLATMRDSRHDKLCFPTCLIFVMHIN
jgi:hypothetical protein